MKLLLCTLMLSSLIVAQETSWERAEPASHTLHLFHSPYVASLPTAETMQQGDLEFEVSHRFTRPVTTGYETFWGFDGPATIRLALGYAVTDNFMVHVGRSNVTDNLELQFKHKLWERNSDVLPLMFSIRGAVVYNGEVFTPLKINSMRYQAYGQAILNTQLGESLALGLVPSYLYNADIFANETQYSFTLGSAAQYYFSTRMSLLAEWNPTVSGLRQTYNSITLGLEIETGGHFFKIVLSNNDKVNTSQYLVGADKDVTQGDVGFGFMITRTF